MSGFETLGGILNIKQIISVILTHTGDHKSISAVLEDAARLAEQIDTSIKHLAPLELIDDFQVKFVNDTIQDFAGIQNQLLGIKEKLENHTTARNVRASANTLTELKVIESQLRQKEHNIQVIGMICSLSVKTNWNRRTLLQISKDIGELKKHSNDMEPAETVLRNAIQRKFAESSTLLDNSERDDWEWMVHMGATDKLVTGVSFYKGSISHSNYQKAARYLHAAAKAGEGEAYYYLGMMYRIGQGMEKCNLTAVKMFREGIRAKDAAAMTGLAQCYYHGVGVEKNRLLGVTYVELGSNGGDPIGMSMLSWQKLYGSDVQQNPTCAFELSKKAINKGNQQAKMNLATCYLHGVGVERDATMAVQLWTEAIEAGGYSCIPDLARCYEEGLGVPINLEKAMSLYRDGTEDLENSWRSEIVRPYYGLCLVRGSGVEQNIEKGWAEIQNALKANSDMDNTWFVLGECYRHGYGIRKNMPKAIDCYLRATLSPDLHTGKKRALFALGSMYETGEGVDRDQCKAFQYFNVGAKYMYRDAQWKVALKCESGIGIEKHEVRAVEYFRLAANNGHRLAQIKSWKYYMKGKGIQRNLMSVIELLKPAAESGDREAKGLLRRLEGERRTRPKQSASF